MVKLDIRGDLQAAVVAFYFPILILTFIYTLRYGFSRDAGWIFLFLFCVIRITGGALFIAAEEVQPPKNGLYTAAYTLESAGLSPLLLATIGFLGLVGKNSFSENTRMMRVFRFVGFLSIVALALSISGGVTGSSSNPNEVKRGRTLRQVGAIFYAVVYALLVIVHAASWSYYYHISRRGRTLLTGISSALPFLGVRVVYSILSAYSTSKPGLAKFDSVRGDWKLYLVMSLVMEYIVVLIYAIVGAMTPSRKGYW